ncbi:hypothetical protein Q4489_09585 [Thalassotalea sp. 1_MG-2023]|nr:hypothetical protein [Thalassotalea sp. 1_MG-2023]MDO6427264.1 hypothetical protein [Thalassotalea sp. 1_MG-2023]
MQHRTAGIELQLLITFAYFANQQLDSNEKISFLVPACYLGFYLQTI